MQAFFGITPAERPQHGARAYGPLNRSKSLDETLQARLSRTSVSTRCGPAFVIATPACSHCRDRPRQNLGDSAGRREDPRPSG
jgi:hypothetical protein